MSQGDIDGAVGSADAAIDRLAAINDVVHLRAVANYDRRVLGEVRTFVATTEAAASGAAGAVTAAKDHSGDARHQLVSLAIAAYTGAAYDNPEDGPDAVEATTNPLLRAGDAGSIQDAQEFVAVITGQVEAAVHRDHQAFGAAVVAARRSVAAVASARALQQRDRRDLVLTDRAIVVASRIARQPVAAATSGARGINQGPTVLGPSLVTAAELAAWYRSTGERAAASVPMARLAADYVAAGSRTGVRADLAFAQSVVETGYFSFPAGGQLTGLDNNFAGIGACDSCAHGWTFPDALTGVTAQLELLEAYATPHRIPTPLIGEVGVGGCCPTWMALSGTWATNEAYGIEILGVYTRILDWVIPRRLAAAGLAPFPTSRAKRR